jgi:hypothetical protein
MFTVRLSVHHTMEVTLPINRLLLLLDNDVPLFMLPIISQQLSLVLCLEISSRVYSLVDSLTILLIDDSLDVVDE